MSIILDHINYIYSKGTSEEIKALDDICLEIKNGDFIGLIGHTGSGKSTLVQHLDGLLRATSGHIYYDGEDIYDDGYDMRALRGKVGLVFQYPEHQLFEEDVFKDVCFGPKNMGMSDKDTELAAYSALRSVKLPDDLFFVSPFELSGGQKRRAAIAGVLAMKPEVLVLDEPTSGLDPFSRNELLDIFSELKKDGVAVFFSTHIISDIEKCADDIIYISRGRIIAALPKEAFVEKYSSAGESLEETMLRLEGGPVHA